MLRGTRIPTMSLALVALSVMISASNGASESAALEVSHTPAACAPAGGDIRVVAMLSQVEGIVAVNLSYMSDTASAWTTVRMTFLAPGEWDGDIDYLSTRGKYVLYNFEAVNVLGERAQSPDGGGWHRLALGTEMFSYCLDETQRVILLMGVVVIVCLIAIGVAIARSRRNK